MALSHGGYRLPLEGFPGHVYRTLVDMGWVGVDLFFVLSGFLITRILLRTKARPGYLKNFYARRTLRIFPAYYLWLLFVLVVIPRLDFFEAFRPFWTTGGASSLWYWFYASNFAFAIHGLWLHPLLSLTWSLAIEEQFYLVWPWVVRALTRQRLRIACIAIIAFALLLRSGLFLADVSPMIAFVLTPCRFDSLAVGALVAVISAEDGGSLRLLRWARFVLPLSAVGVVILLTAIQTGFVPPGPQDGLRHQPLMYTVGYSLIAAFFGAALVFAGFGRARRTRWLSFTPLRIFGRYSYAMYLTHTFVGGFLLLNVFNPLQVPGWGGALLSYALEWSAQLGVAMLSWFLIESRFLRWKDRFVSD